MQGLAKASLLMGDYPQATKLFGQLVEQARAKGKPSGSTLSNLGLARFLSGHLSEAEKALKEAIAEWDLLRDGESYDLDDDRFLYPATAQT